MKILVTGALGLVGSEAVKFYLERGHDVYGIDNNMRETFFGSEGNVSYNNIEHDKYHFIHRDIRDATRSVAAICPDVVIHAAAQPSHDWAATNPFLDFSINANGTHILLEACRQYVPECVFIHVSTNKVYGDRPNKLHLVELETRYEGPFEGIGEDMSVDTCLHSLFGVSKLSGDLLAQEYGKYFGLKTGIFRCGCITGAAHAAVPLHGFLAYMARCKKENIVYRVNGYKGKQVRDNIHAYDLITAFDEFIKNPRPGEVYNMGGGRYSNISVMEALKAFGVKHIYEDRPRIGDHQWYISSVDKFKKDYPKWEYKYDMEAIIEDLVSS